MLRKMILVALIMTFIALFFISCAGRDEPPESHQAETAATSEKGSGAVDVIVLITVDSLRYDHLGCYGNKNIKTPAMDGIASEGILFERCLTPVPQNLPAHSAIMTGLYPEKTGVFDDAVFKLPEKFKTLAERLKEHGYVTAAFIGSAVLDRRFGLAQGFDLYHDNFDSLLTNTSAIFSERKAGEVVSQVLSFMEGQRKGKKLFLWIHLNDPNYPFSPPDPFEKSYRGEIEYCDSQIRNLTAFLKSSGKYESSAIILTSDHGISLGQFNEKKYGINLYEPSVRVPLIIRVPESFGQKSAKTPGKISATVGLIDIAPTILALAGVNKEEPSLDGYDLSELVTPAAESKGEAAERRIHFLSSYHQFFAFGWKVLRAADDGEWKYIDGKGCELYGISSDSKETENQLERNRDAAERMKSLLQNFEKNLSLYKQEDNRPLYNFSTTRNLSYIGYSWCPVSFFGSGRSGKFDRLQEIEDILETAQLGVLNKTPGKTLAELNKILEIDPENYLSLHFIASLQLFGGRVKMAAKTFSEMERSYPDWPETYHMRGHMEIADKDFEKALQTFGRVIGIDPMNSEALYDSACMHSLLNRKEKALEFLDRSIAAGYDDFSHIQEDPDLTNIRDSEEYKTILNRYMRRESY
ncbi:MAG: sulfatase-like hydrolase/transferase [Acidobacteriota bacterium]